MQRRAQSRLGAGHKDTEVKSSEPPMGNLGQSEYQSK